MELLLAMSVIAVGLFAAVTLVYSNLALVDRDTDEVIAVNLAREGVELAKMTRDSNWLAGNAFDAGMLSGSDYTATPVWDGVVTSPSFEFTPGALGDANTRIVESSNASARSFLANYNAAPVVTGTSTGFLRLLTFHPICDDLTVLNSGSTCEPGKLKIGIRVESAIRWTRKGKVQNFTIYEDLYDWR